MTQNAKQIIVENPQELGRYASKHFMDIAESCIKEKGFCAVALSGGSTPKLLYQYLVKDYSYRKEWLHIDFFWSDERTVPLDHPDSNAGMAFQYLIDPLHIKEKNVFPIYRQEKNPTQAALDYEKTIKDYFASKNSSVAFDLVILGLGNDGHVASLFPDTTALKEKTKLVTDNWVEKLGKQRITFTYPLINQSRTCMFLISGDHKSVIVRDIITSRENKYPAQYIDLKNGQIYYYLDAKAARLLGDPGEMKGGPGHEPNI